MNTKLARILNHGTPHNHSATKSAIHTDQSKVLGVGSAQPETSYSQQEVLERFQITNKVVQRFMKAPHIQKRHLILPELDSNGKMREETPADLHRKFAVNSVSLSQKAIKKAIENAGIQKENIDFLCAVTSTGFLVPGLASRIIAEMKLPSRIQKTDIVGMGCNAAVSAMIQVSNWTKANPGKNAVMVCCEINSASYVNDHSIRTGIVNSLFGDNASAIVVNGQSAPKTAKLISLKYGTQNQRTQFPGFVDFESLIISEQLESMKFDFDSIHQKNSFYLSKDIPFVIGTYVPQIVDTLLKRNGIDAKDVKHWVIHTGGAAVINSVRENLNLSEHDVRHTRSVLRDFGNVSSGSVLLSLERLLAENVAKRGDTGVMIAMGPGASIDAGLMRW